MSKRRLRKAERAEKAVDIVVEDDTPSPVSRISGTPFIARPLSGGVHEPSNKAIMPDKNTRSVGYTVAARVVEADCDHSFCKKETISGREHYFVRVGTFGPGRGYFYDPWSNMYPGDSIEYAAEVDRNTGKRRFDWRAVTEECFDLYKSFLQVKHARHLRQAERIGTL